MEPESVRKFYEESVRKFYEEKEKCPDLANLRELIQDDIVTYFGAYEGNIPFTYTNEQHETFIDDLCGIVVSKVNDLIEKQSG